jgi:phosphate transport system permease protein
VSETASQVRKVRDTHQGDRVFAASVRAMAWALAILLGLIGVFLLIQAWPALSKFGLGFFRASTWNPVSEIFGAAPVIYGTIVSSLLAILIAAPLSIGAALFLNELAPRGIARVLGFLLQMLSAIPSVVYGLWGIFVLAPWLRTTVEPMLASAFGFLPFFQGPSYGVGMMAAGVILAIMITPTIASISVEVFRAIPRAQREAALALGSTRWEMIRISVLASARTGLFGAVMLGLGRAIGETMAVTMVIGNRAEISASLFAPGQTMASVIANEFAEATSDMHLSSLAAVGLALFGVTFTLNALARLLVLAAERRAKA